MDWVPLINKVVMFVLYKKDNFKRPKKFIQNSVTSTEKKLQRFSDSNLSKVWPQTGYLWETLIVVWNSPSFFLPGRDSNWDHFTIYHFSCCVCPLCFLIDTFYSRRWSFQKEAAWSLKAKLTSAVIERRAKNKK